MMASHGKSLTVLYCSAPTSGSITKCLRSSWLQYKAQLSTVGPQATHIYVSSAAMDSHSAHRNHRRESSSEELSPDPATTQANPQTQPWTPSNSPSQRTHPPSQNYRALQQVLSTRPRLPRVISPTSALAAYPRSTRKQAARSSWVWRAKKTRKGEKHGDSCGTKEGPGTQGAELQLHEQNYVHAGGVRGSNQRAVLHLENASQPVDSESRQGQK
ncbi:hypothetical protein BDZ91DRAFT_714270 [Kalaharituber pfeilii]|nr:hypothetical protein BDZ91DRAFT_714270 [Kalaharituber pfeilii]